MLLSAGWDSAIRVWDLRVHRAVRSIPGPYVCGDALDVSAGGSPYVLAGSWRAKNPLQLFDLGSGRLLTNLPFWQPEPNGCLIYAARFGTGDATGTVVAGGSGATPLVRVYDLKAPGNVDLSFTTLLTRPVHGLAFVAAAPAAASGKLRGASVAVACDHAVHLVPLRKAA